MPSRTHRRLLKLLVIQCIEMRKRTPVAGIKSKLAQVTVELEAVRDIVAVTAEPPVYLQNLYNELLEKRENLLRRLHYFRTTLCLTIELRNRKKK